MKQSTQHRLARLEARQAEQQPYGRHILVEVYDLSAAEAERRIVEAEAEKQPNDLLIIVDCVRDLSYLEGYDNEAGI